MSNDNVFKLIQLGVFEDHLTEVLRNGARALLAQAVEIEVSGFIASHAGLKTPDGRQRVVRHGHLPEREVMCKNACNSDPLRWFFASKTDPL